MYCPFCGAKIDKTQKFCPNCGIRIKKPSKATQPISTINNVESIVSSPSTPYTKLESKNPVVMGALSCALAVAGVLLTFFVVYANTDVFQDIFPDMYADLISNIYRNDFKELGIVYKPNIIHLILPLICFILGLVLGIFGVISAKKTKVWGIIGIILNSIILLLYSIDAYLRFYVGKTLGDYIFGSSIFILFLIIGLICLRGRRRRY